MATQKYNSFYTVYSMSTGGDTPTDLVLRFVRETRSKLGFTPECCDVDAFTFGKLCDALRCEPTVHSGIKFVKFDGVKFYERAPDGAMNFNFKLPHWPLDDKPDEAQTMDTHALAS